MKVSIIVPSFNQGNYIQRTLDSIYSQNYLNLEVIIVDGNSTDETFEVVKNYRPKPDVVIFEEDNGQSDAINKGLLRATGDVVGWINSDDLLEENCINKIVQAFSDDDLLDFVYGDVLFIDNNDTKLFLLKGRRVKVPNILYSLDVPIPQQGSFWRKRFIDSMPYFLNTNYHFVLDRDLFLRTCLTARVLYLDAVLGRFRLHEFSKSVSQQREWLVEIPLLYSEVIAKCGPMFYSLKPERLKRRITAMVNLYFSLEWLKLGSLRKSLFFVLKAHYFDFFILIHSNFFFKIMEFSKKLLKRMKLLLAYDA